MTETTITVIAAALVIWSLISVAKSAMRKNRKLLWFAIVILLPIIGPLVYFFFEIQKDSE
ncbi:PLD nuclease N-terminal domain-containing protein [Reichenbachiella ulvae]|uniref:PLD nuclease N-terminal domain-containing protein n=1 Tax=Reichenbachiella ulvae TaxID=2980104 RepID=A0ABT3CRW8_9BACT|nr:PLD nuclease N-terminal domain-containing protein [Reichenbachiella ulvae]MCV9386254.1 PLD nuclease N-terminal domain-containing protein [Reichenbachiella ulvae]